MNERLAQIVWDTIVQMWQEKKTPQLESGLVYQQLIEHGEDIPDYALNDIFEYLKANSFVNGTGYMHPDDAKKHGAFLITYVNSDFL